MSIPESITATRTPFPVSPSVPVCTGRKQEAALARFRAKNSLFGFSAYSISGSAITPGTSRSGTRRIAKSLKRYVPDASGNFAFKALPRSPWYFTMISHGPLLAVKAHIQLFCPLPHLLRDGKRQIQ